MVKLYEFEKPCEQKFGGELTEYEKKRLVRSCELPSMWNPYPERPARVENICGKLVRIPLKEDRQEGWSIARAGPPLDIMDDGGNKGVRPGISQVCFKKYSPFGAQTEVYHLHGHVTVRNAPGLPKSVSFKGVRGIQAARELSMDMLYPEETTGVAVHMCVVGLNLGKRVQTSPCCYLENRIGAEPLDFAEVGCRTIDTCNTVRLSVVDWKKVGLAEELWPAANDLLITGKGSVMHRYTWKNVEWNEENEALVLAASQWVADRIFEVV